eukprot:9492145-Pyramimonas_sp.AAC.1
MLASQAPNGASSDVSTTWHTRPVGWIQGPVGWIQALRTGPLPGGGVGEEAFGEVGPALLHDRELLVDADTDALQRGKGARDVQEVRRQLEATLWGGFKGTRGGFKGIRGGFKARAMYKKFSHLRAQ